MTASHADNSKSRFMYLVPDAEEPSYRERRLSSGWFLAIWVASVWTMTNTGVISRILKAKNFMASSGSALF